MPVKSEPEANVESVGIKVALAIGYYDNLVIIGFYGRFSVIM